MDHPKPTSAPIATAPFNGTPQEDDVVVEIEWLEKVIPDRARRGKRGERLDDRLAAEAGSDLAVYRASRNAVMLHSASR